MDNAARSEGSHLGKTIKFKGDILGGDDLFVDGEVQGSVQLPAQSVVVGPNGQLNAEVQARELVVQGKLKGNAKAQDRIEVTRSGSVMGDLAMARISIQDGAFMQGRVDIRAAEAPIPVVRPAAAAPAAAPAAAVPAASGGPQQTSLLDRKP